MLNRRLKARHFGDDPHIRQKYGERQTIDIQEPWERRYRNIHPVAAGTMPNKTLIVFKKAGRLWSIPLSQARNTAVRTMLEGAIIVQNPRRPFEKPKLYRIKKRALVPSLPPREETHRRSKPIPPRSNRPWHPMNVGLQRHTLERELRRQGVAPDLVDFGAQLDPTLSLGENRGLLQDQIRTLSGRNDLSVEPISAGELDYEERRFIDSMKDQEERQRRGISEPPPMPRNFEMF